MEGVPAELYATPKWYACWTRGRAEKKVDRYMAGAGIRSYLPLIERERQWADRKKRVMFPLFPGYVFARFKLTELYQVLRTPGLVTVVQMNGHPTPLRDGEVESVRALVDGVNRTGIPPAPSDYLARGQAVVVIDGPFRGMRGTLQEIRGEARVVVRLSAIRLAVGVEMDRRFLRPEASANGANGNGRKAALRSR